MIVLHAVWETTTPGKLHLWAEASHLVKSATRHTSKQDGKPRLHPFALTRDNLLEAASELLGSLFAQSAGTDTVTLRLPSTGSGPLPSPELILKQPIDDKKGAEFKWWYVVSAVLDAGAALDFLLGLPARAPTGIAFGSDLRFWVEAARFSLELLTRQCFVPTLHESARGRSATCRAAWEAILSPEDDERMQRLARLMPPVCWSFVPPEQKNVLLLRQIVQDFLNQTVDAFVRENLSSLLPTKRRRSPDALQEQWVQALTSAESSFSAPVESVKKFSSELRGWLGQLRPVEAGAPFRTCFRLDPPEGEDEQVMGWHVGFYLQANDDRSLIVPAEKVWTERSSTLTFLKRKFENPQERLLADLGKASRLFPAIEESLKAAHPQQLELSTEQAYTFLRESAPLLEQSGFGVLVPPWWQKPTAKVGVKLKVKPKVGAATSSGLMGLNSIVDYNWQVAIGGTTLSAREFENLVNLKQPLIKVRGQWVELRPEQIEAAIAFFKKKRANKDMSLGEALRIGLGQGTAEMGLPVLDIEAEGWLKDALGRLSQNVPLTNIKVPATFQGKLRPYQLKGVSWLAFLKEFGFGACLADSMGLGKCLAACSSVVVNGTLHKAEDIWSLYAAETVFDGEGYWAEPTKQLLVNAINETTGKMVQAPIKHLYRQQVSTHLRKVQLEDGSSITITYPHKLLTDKGWTNELHVGDYVCVPAKLLWEGQPEDPDLIKFLEWQIAETRTHLHHLLDQEVFYCRIKSIEDVPYDGWVYDFEVENHHNFVANGILCHNTIQLITLLLHERDKQNGVPAPTLLICPMSIVGNWHKELQRFAPSLSVMIHYGPERLSDQAFAEEARKHDVVITTYSLALRDKEQLAAVAWENVVVDEAQNIKNETAKQTQAIKQLQGKYKIALTGTPVENRLSELWSIMEFLNPGYLGTGTDFRQSFAIPIERYHNAERSQTLKKLVQPFMLRRLKTDKTIIQDLPDKMEMNVFCNLTQEQASLYEAVVKEMMEKIEQSDGMERRGLILATLMKLKQVCNHPAHFLSDHSSLARRSGKLARLEEMLEEVLEGGEKALIFTQFAEMGELLQQYLEERFGCEILFLHGSTPKKQRDMMVQRFQEEQRGAPLFLLSLKAGGVGLNLTAANHVFHFDRWWNPAVENQATDRAFRIGQKKNVQVHKFVCVGTLEERIDQMIEQKKELAESIVGSGENWLTEMSTEQLKSLFSLSREAVGE